MTQLMDDASHREPTKRRAFVAFDTVHGDSAVARVVSPIDTVQTADVDVYR